MFSVIHIQLAPVLSCIATLDIMTKLTCHLNSRTRVKFQDRKALSLNNASYLKSLTHNFYTWHQGTCQGGEITLITLTLAYSQ